jgi:predicted DNA-binding transcriptional regulator YafY
VRALAEKCGVTERTIYRDIVSLSMANIPIYFDRGYRLLGESSIPPNCFSDKEANFLVDLLRPSRRKKIVKGIIKKIQASKPAL